MVTSRKLVSFLKRLSASMVQATNLILGEPGSQESEPILLTTPHDRIYFIS
jgi:hypothetical protein